MQGARWSLVPMAQNVLTNSGPVTVFGVAVTTANWPRQKIVSAWRSVDQELYRLRLRGRNVDATANHRFLRVKPVHHKTTGGRAMIRTCGWSSAGEGEGAHLPEEDLVATGI
jgi:hypothetical protein